MASSRTVYIVEDDDAVRNAMRLLLEIHDYRVETFRSAEELLERQVQALEGCLLTDLVMGGMSGVDLIENLRARGVRIPMALMSGRLLTRPEQSRIAGMTFLPKPVAPGDLLDWLESLEDE
ncbi:MAG TPA: response regulator [Rhizomicrobium sp.]|nr:response regulator [Rhizomicrobium sp.]